LTPRLAWHKATFPNKYQSISYHLAKHGKGRSAIQYTRDAMDFYQKNKHLGKPVTLKDGTSGIVIKFKTKDPVTGKTLKTGGFWTDTGKLVTFWD